MIIKLHSFSVPVKIDTEKIKAYVWNIELAKVELVMDLDKGIKVPIDEELYEIEEMFNS